MREDLGFCVKQMRKQHSLRCFTGGEAQNTGAAEDHTGASWRQGTLVGWSSGEEMENEVSLHPRAFAFMFDIPCMQQAGFLSLFSLEEKKITFLENVACRVKHVLLLQRTGRSRPPPWSIVVFWAMTKAVEVDDVRRDCVREVTCPQPLKTRSVSIHV